MSQGLINAYRRDLAKLRAATGSTNEGVLSEAFKDLLKAWGKQLDLTFAAQHRFTAPDQSQRAADGALLYAGVRLPFGWWEAKDQKDDLDAEIEAKFRAGYPKDNIIFTDDRTAVLFQDGRECRRCSMVDDALLLALLEQFFGYQRPEFAEFAKARTQFRHDLPQVLDALRAAITEAEAGNAAYRAAATEFLAQAKAAINPRVTADDVREMLIQHILTEDIFNHVFDQTGYHRENNVAQALSKLEATFFKGDLRQRTVERLKSYYSGLRASAARLESRTEKQKLLKDVYEDFYKTYNPKAADRLGVVYTPGEIVRFMIQSADWLCERHFGKTMIHPDVEILDPATGTGTFVVELLEHFNGHAGFKQKYAEGLHANEVAILPYYVANLNIEATYKALTGEYKEFPGLCFVDTLDNTAGLKLGKATGELFGGMSDENADRIAKQNKRKISVVIGNPPYNANQQNENDNNKNRDYAEIDKRIKATYIKASTAQKTKLYDMYSRFFRWASDRIEDDGIVAFITNRSFLDMKNFDGFRKVIGEEFSDIWIVDLGGDVRANPKISGTKHNVFGIQTGVAISFLVKRRGEHGCRIHYTRRPEFETADEKRAWLSAASIDSVSADLLRPDVNNTWLRLGREEFATLMPIASKQTKLAKIAAQERALFRMSSLGTSTNRDEWLYDQDEESVLKKARWLVAGYEATPLTNVYSGEIKWSESLKRRHAAARRERVDAKRVRQSLYRPFSKEWLYDSNCLLIDVEQQMSYSAVGIRHSAC